MTENDILSYLESCIIQYRLQGKTRDEIAQAFAISQGTVANIIAKFRKRKF